MSRLPAFLSRRTRLFALILGLVAAVFFLVPPPHADAYICADGYTIYTFIYYSNSSHTTEVGECFESCSGPEQCSGQKTAYYVMVQSGCCDF